jgi:hypothetical protein
MADDPIALSAYSKADDEARIRNVAIGTPRNLTCTHAITD